MFERLFKKFTTSQPKSSVLTSNLDAQHQIQYSTVQSPTAITTVDVPESQSCVLAQADKDCTQLPSGTHELHPDTFEQTRPLHYFYVRDNSKSEGDWSLDYTDHHHVKLSLTGTYSIKIDSPQRLMQFCLKGAQFHNDHDFSQWISQCIATILKAQRVPVEDIHAENVRFTNYLRDALALALRPRGLALHALSLNILKPEHEKATSNQAKTTDSDSQSEKVETAEHQENAPSVEQVIIHQEQKPEKLFYYVRNGQQHGPFSHADIEQKLADGVLSKRDLLWQKGLTTWKPIAEFPEFQS
ncbi:DUF4339 domain-containing protein [Cardiobacteriaceae bacterium TAE3-ERU3]|nr:DUF4339 domain-containing protein [Cardiobacteriaceae bacterium TAE3-ERU3]